MPAADGGQVLLGDPQPGARRAGEGAGLTLLALVIGVLALAAGAAVASGQWSGRARLRRNMAKDAAARAARLAVLAADPVRAKYVARIEAGEAWSDAQIAYDLDPLATNTCEHLRPIEQAMRTEGVVLKMTRELICEADCRIDFPRLQDRGWPPEGVGYTERQNDGRALGDPWYAALGCTRCLSSIHLHHPTKDVPPDTPWWPTR